MVLISSQSPTFDIICLFIVDILVIWCLIVVLIGISLVASDSGHLFMCLVDIYKFCLEKCIVISFDHFN